MKKINEKSSSLDILSNVVENALKVEFATLSRQSQFASDVLFENATTKQILKAYGYDGAKKPQRDAFCIELKNATFDRYANLPSLVESVEKDATTGKNVTCKYTRKMPAIWYNDEKAAIIGKSCKLVALIDPETGGRHEKIVTVQVPIYKDVEITYKDSKGETKKRKVKQVAEYKEEKQLLHAYLRPVWTPAHIAEGLACLFSRKDAENTISAKLLREFENAAKK